MALADDPIAAVNASLLANLSWLDNAYGKVQRMTRRDEKGNPITFPGVYVGGSTNDYISVLPDESLGNYSYFEIKDPAKYININKNFTVEFEFKISFFFNWIDIFGEDNYKEASIEAVKEQILNVLVNTQFLRSIETFEVWEDANSIFQNFTDQGYISSYDHHQIEGQFLMKNFGGIAISGVIVSLPSCSNDLPTPSVPPYIFNYFPANYSLSEQIFPLLKWFGDNVYWWTFYFEAGNNAEVTLPGLNVADVGKMNVVPAEYRAINSITGDEECGTIQLQLNGSGGYKVFLADFLTEIFITPFYTKG